MSFLLTLFSIRFLLFCYKCIRPSSQCSPFLCTPSPCFRSVGLLLYEVVIAVVWTTYSNQCDDLCIIMECRVDFFFCFCWCFFCLFLIFFIGRVCHVHVFLLKALKTCGVRLEWGLTCFLYFPFWLCRCGNHQSCCYLSFWFSLTLSCLVLFFLVFENLLFSNLFNVAQKLVAFWFK